MAVTQDHIKEMVRRLDALRGHFDVALKAIELEEENLKRQDPDFWNSPKEAEITEKNIRQLQKWLAEFDAAQSALDDVQVVFDFFKEGEATESELEEARNTALACLDQLEFKKCCRAKKTA